MSGRPTVSVIVPARDQEPYLEETLRSAIAERPLEILVVTTLSGASAAVAAELGVRVLGSEDSGTAPQPRRNLGARASRGEAIAFLDADDRFPAGRNELLSKALGDVVVGLVQGFVSPDRVDHLELAENDPVLKASPAPLSGTALIRREAFLELGGFADDLLVGELAEWLSRAEDAGLEISRIEEIVLERRIHGRGHLFERQTEDARASFLRLARERILRSQGG